MPLLTVNNLAIWDLGDGEGRVLLSDVSFSLERNRILGIVGESGSGKSVLSYSITHLLPANLKVTSGEIAFDGKDITRLNEKEARKLRGKRISMVFQEPMSALNPFMPCGKQVAEVLETHTSLPKSEIKKEILSLFGRVCLPDPERIYKAYPHELSGGQKQRVVIAIAVACRPDLLIADEPTTALDVSVQKEIVRLLKDLQKESGMAVIFISHDLALVSSLADDVLVLRKGRAMEYGPANKLFENPESDYARGLIACRPPRNERLRRLPVVGDFTGGNTFSREVIREEELERRTAEIEKRVPLLRVENLGKYYRRDGKLFKAVDSVSLTVYEGETLGLVGESGSGKTTLSRALLMLDPPEKGNVFYRGTDIMKLKPSEIKKLRREMQIIFQDPFASLNPLLTVERTLTEPMKVHGLAGSDALRRDYAVSLLEKTGLTADDLKKYPHEFSGGQRQRIGIARSLVLSPRFIICDESVSALDVSVQAQVLNLLSDLKEEFGFTYLFISHDLGVVRHMSDHLLVIRNGREVEYGRSEDVFAHPGSDYTRTLIESSPRMDESKK